MRPTRYSDEMIRDYTTKGYWEDITYSDLYERNAQNYPNKEAYTDEARSITWSQANLEVTRIAAKLIDLGLSKDDVVVCHLPNTIDLVLFRVACEKAGLMNVSAARTLRDQEIGFILKDTNAKAYVAFHKFRDFDYWEMINKLRPDLPCLEHIFIAGDDVPDNAISINEVIMEPLENKFSKEDFQERKLKYHEVAWVEFTSGSTGFPKVVECPLALRTFAAKSHMQRLRMTGDDIVGAFAPISGAGRPGYYFPPFVGASCILMENFDAGEALQLIQDKKINIVAIVPTQLIQMLRQPDFDKFDLSSVRVLNSTGAPLPYNVAEEAEERFNCKIINHYGGIDAGSVAACDFDDPTDIRRFAVGKLHVGNEVKLVNKDGEEVPVGDIGEVCFRGPGAVGGYWKDPDMTKEVWKDGWFHMGDLGKLDEFGNLMIVGREKQVIIRGGQNIYPTEVENILQNHSKVGVAVIVKMPDPVMGEKACAYIVPRKKEEAPMLEELTTFLKNQGLAPFKCPERVEIIDSIPLVSDAKVDKPTLEKDILEKLKLENKVS